MIKVKFDLTWNGLTTMTSDEQWYLGAGSAPAGGGSFITQHNVHIAGENVYASITPGINTLTLSHPVYSYQNSPWKSDISMHIYKVVIAIEYEYLG